MALGTVTKYGNTVMGNKRVRWGTAILSTAYTADGEAVTAANFGLTRMHNLQVSPAGDAANAYVIRWDRATGKILAYEQTAPADLGAVNIPLVEDTAGGSHAGIPFNWVATGV